MAAYDKRPETSHVLLNRREFIKNTARISAAGVLLSPSGLFASERQVLKVGLVGCGARGKGALKNFLEAAQHRGIQAEVTAIADYVKETALAAATELGVPQDRCHSGVEAYKNVLATEAEVVLLVTPPMFRPVHFDAAIKAGKHVFMEKPAAVDPPGARAVMETGCLAKTKNLTVVAGTHRRHDANYLKTYAALQQDAIGPIRGGQIYWCQKRQRRFERRSGEDDATYLIRNWISFTEMSGDHIVEQHLHNIDVANWFVGRPPQTAIGFGGRARRQTGNQFDFFSVDFDYGEGVHIHSMCRQMDGCYDRVSEFFIGTKGSTWGTGPGQEGFTPPVTIPNPVAVDNPFVQEHIDLIDSILNNQGRNEAQTLAETTMTALMGRISAYTGQLVRWKDLTDEAAGSEWYSLSLRPGPLDFENGTVTAPPENTAPIPGKDSIPVTPIQGA